MATIRAYFEASPDVPLVATGDLPTIRIRRTDTQALVVTDANMTEQGDGNFTFEFAPGDGLEYVVRADGDPLASGQVNGGGRYAHGSVSGNTSPLIKQGWTRAVTGGSKLRAIISLDLDGKTVALPGTATLAVSLQDSTGSNVFVQSGLNPNSDGVFALEEVGPVPVPGTVLAAFATIVFEGNTYVSVTELAIPEFEI